MDIGEHCFVMLGSNKPNYWGFPHCLRGTYRHVIEEGPIGRVVNTYLGANLIRTVPLRLRV